MTQIVLYTLNAIKIFYDKKCVIIIDKCVVIALT